MNDTLNHALELADRGYHLFPLISGGKTPALTGNWQDAATRDSHVLERWFARTNCNIAVACEPSGIFAIDLDTAKAGADGPAHGIESLRELAAGRDLPRTLTVATPSGGTHLYFRQPADGTLLRNTARRLGPLIDTRGIGGYLVAPGSRIDGRAYRITDDVPLAELPTWITALLRPPEQALADPEIARQVPTGLGSPYARAALGRETARVAAAKPGQRNHTLNQAAFSLGRLIADGLLDRAQVENQLTLAANAAGLDSAETQATLNSGITAGLQRHHVRIAATAARSIPTPTLGTTAARPVHVAEPEPAESARESRALAPQPTSPRSATINALHAAFDALERELAEPSAVSMGGREVSPLLKQNVAPEALAENAADLLNEVAGTVRNVERRAAALARTPEWQKIRAIANAASDLVRQVRQAAQHHADDFRTDVFIHGAMRTVAARTCRQLAELASAAADRLAHHGLTDTPTFGDLQAIRRTAQRVETRLTGHVPGQPESEQRAAARNQLNQLRRDLRTRPHIQDPARAQKAAMRAAVCPSVQHRPRP